MELLSHWVRKQYVEATLTVETEEGQGLVEYALIIGLVALASVVVLGSFGLAVNSLLNTAIPFP